MTQDSAALETSIVSAIRRIIRAVDLHSHKLLDVCGLTGPQIAALDKAAELGPISIGSLARSLNLSHPTVTGIVSRLEARGLVRRDRAVADRRRIEVCVTDEGTRILGDAPSLLQDRFRQQLARLEEWEQHQFLATLQRIAAMMDAEDLDAAPHLIVDAQDLGAAANPEDTEA